ncbi:MAG: cytochrome c biogenesis protein ResB [Calditrichaeota bacterium]|nr:cytochrome c biogenesis protein ResB [Calditrichota bacterium]
MPEQTTNSPILKELGSLKWTVVILFGMIVIMAYATYVESQESHEAALAKGFHSLPMDFLIAALAVNLIACTLSRAPYRPHQYPWLVTHLGIILTMVGAIVSHRTAVDGQIILRKGTPATAATLLIDSPQPIVMPLDFRLELDRFEAKFYPGTGKASDYVSYVRFYDETKGIADTLTIRVNHPLVHRGWNISQSSFFPGDSTATILSANKDPGTPVSYAGFLTVFLGLCGLFFLKPWLKKKFPPPPKAKVVNAQSEPILSKETV